MGGESEKITDIKKIHIGYIDISKICIDILSNIGKEKLLKISTESDVYYLRETAKLLLDK